MIKNRSKVQSIILYCAFAVWLVANIIMCINHEPFRDEAQSWLIAKNNSIFGMIRFMWQEGHPWLYHLLIWPLAQLGFPFELLKYTSLLIGSTAMWLYIRHVPFKVPVVIATMCLPFMNYYTTAFARPYTLVLLFSVMVAVSWKTRKEKPIFTGISIGLLACTHLSLWIPVYILTIIFVSEQIRIKKISIASILYLVGIIGVFCGPLVPQMLATFERKGLPAWTFFVALAAFCAITALIIFLFSRKKKSKKIKIYYTVFTLITSISVPLISIAMTLVTPTASMSERYLLITIPVAIMCLWIFNTRNEEIKLECSLYNIISNQTTKEGQNESQTKTKQVKEKFINGLKIAFAVYSVIICALFGFYKIMVKDFTLPYSQSKSAAEYIDSSLPEDAVIVTSHQGLITPVVAQIKNHEIINLHGNVMTYTKWFDEWNDETPVSEWYPALERISKSAGKEIYVIDSPISDFVDFSKWLKNVYDNGTAEFVYKTPDNVVDESEQYRITKISADAFSQTEVKS